MGICRYFAFSLLRTPSIPLISTGARLRLAREITLLSADAMGKPTPISVSRLPVKRALLVRELAVTNLSQRMNVRRTGTVAATVIARCQRDLSDLNWNQSSSTYHFPLRFIVFSQASALEFHCLVIGTVTLFVGVMVGRT